MAMTENQSQNCKSAGSPIAPQPRDPRRWAVEMHDFTDRAERTFWADIRGWRESNPRDYSLWRKRSRPFPGLGTRLPAGQARIESMPHYIGSLRDWAGGRLWTEPKIIQTQYELEAASGHGTIRLFKANDNAMFFCRAERQADGQQRRLQLYIESGRRKVLWEL